MSKIDLFVTERAMDQRNTRREFLGTTLVSATAVQSATARAAEPQPQQTPPQNVEWRNKQPEMSYRRFGRSGLMISEVVSGGDPIGSTNFEHLNLALEMGLNY